MSRAECPSCKQIIEGSLAEIEAHVAGCCPETRSPLPLADSRPETERQLQDAVTRYAREHFWRVYHTYDSRKSPAGFPDLVMCRRRRMVVAELKSSSGRVTAEQHEWLDAIGEAGAETYVWRPADLREAEEVLR